MVYSLLLNFIGSVLLESQTMSCIGLDHHWQSQHPFSPTLSNEWSYHRPDYGMHFYFEDCLGSPACRGAPSGSAAPLRSVLGPLDRASDSEATRSPRDRVRLRSWERGNEEERRSVLCARRLGSVKEEEAPL